MFLQYTLIRLNFFLEIRYDTIKLYLCAQKLTNSQLSLPHGTKKNKE